MDKCLIATFITSVNTSVVTTAELLEKQINTSKSERSFFASSSTFSQHLVLQFVIEERGMSAHHDVIITSQPPRKYFIHV